MSLSSITTSILNSMGLEHKTLIFYIISGVFMLLSIYFLPKFLGIFALLVGFTFIYGLTSILNLILLNKHCQQKPKYLKFLIASTLLAVPTSILGFMLEKLFLPVLGTFFTFLACSTIMIIFNLLLYLGFNLVDFKSFRVKLLKKTA